MIFWLLYTILVILCICTFIYNKVPNDYFNACMATGTVFILGHIILLAISFVVGIELADKGIPVVVGTEKFNIVSLKSTNNISGSFFLGSGGFGACEEYYFMYNFGNGQYKRGRIGTYDLMLKESNSESPNISNDIVFKMYHTKWWPDFLELESKYKTNYVLTVPNETVIQKFEIQ